MTESILESTKKILGIDPSIPVFDLDILTHINTVFTTLEQLGIGPTGGFQITGKEEVWSSFTLNKPLANSVKTYMYLRVRMLFDPPSTSFHLEAIKEQLRELEWRMNVQLEVATWEAPTLPPT